MVELALSIESASRDVSKDQTVSEPFDAAGAGAPTALGVNNCIEAANVRTIDRLIVSGPFVTAGTVSDSCGVSANVALRASR